MVSKASSERLFTMSSALRSTSKSATRGTKASSHSSSGSLVDWFSSHQTIGFAVLSCIWVFALYWRALHAPFVYDDLQQISNNINISSLHAACTRFFFAPVDFSNEYRGGFGGSTYRPLFWISLALDNKLWGNNGSGGFHLTNLLLHWINGLLLFSLLRAIRTPALTAMAAALLWLGMPVNSEAVSWVSARAYLLCGLFLLLSLRAAHSYLRTANLSWLVLYVAGSIAALLSHEEGLLLLPLTILLVYASDQKPRRLWAFLLGLASLTGLLYFLLKTLVGTQSGRGPHAFWSVGLTFWRYVQWMVAPIHLSMERSTSTPPNLPSIAAISAWIALLYVLAAPFLLRKRLPFAAAGLAIAILLLLPVTGIVFLYQGMAERFDYLASAGFALLVASLAFECVKAWRSIALGCIVLWGLWGAWRVKTRVLQWSDPVQLYRSSLEATPNSFILYDNLGFQLNKEGDRLGAVQAFQQAIKLRPNYPQALSSLGDVSFQLGRPSEAVEAYSRSLAFKPTDVATLVNLAAVLEQMGKKQEAEQQLRKAALLAPDNQSIYLNLGVLLFQENRIDDAIKYFQKAIDLKPSDPTAYYDLAVLFQQGGRNDLAVPFYKKVLELKPGDSDTISNLSKMSKR
jgi:protein O-mannosyl-transferase